MATKLNFYYNNQLDILKINSIINGLNSVFIQEIQKTLI